MKIRNFFLTLCVIIFTFTTINSYAQFGIDLEGGIARSGYNDVRIPGDTGTKFSLSEELKAENVFYYRLRLNYTFNRKHTVSLLYAPLTFQSKGTFDNDVIFQETTFPAGAEIDGTYTFNSYRLTYRYQVYRSDKFDLGFGLTAKIRDATIRLESGVLDDVKDNLGFVPLINFRAFYEFSDVFGLLFTGDALAAPQGRAEDVLAALTWDVVEKVRLKAGYRILEGGADNDEVYTFALVHFGVLGVNYSF